MKHPELTEFRRKLNMNQTEFAESLGVQQALIAMIEKGTRKPSQTFIIKLMDKYGFQLNEGSPEYVLPENIITIPLFHIGAAAGEGTYLLDEPDTQTIYFDKRFLQQVIKTSNYDSLQLLYASGDSMDSGWNQPDDIKDGDLLLIDTSITSGNNHIFVILVNNSELRVKRLFKRGEALYISSNNSKYKEEVYYPDNTDFELKVIGRVIWNFKTLF